MEVERRGREERKSKSGRRLIDLMMILPEVGREIDDLQVGGELTDHFLCRGVREAAEDGIHLNQVGG